MEKKEQKEQKQKKPYIAPEVKCVAMETSGMIATSQKATHAVAEDYNVEDADYTTDGNSFNVW